MLAPFRPGDRWKHLDTTLDTSAGALAVRITPEGDAVSVTAPGRPGAAVRREVTAAVRRILNLDLDLGPFHDAVAKRSDLAWIAETGAGRLMRGASGFEDIVKLVLTTNCSWALTTRMNENLVDRYGARAADGSRAFPRPARLARVRPASFRGAVRAGYRAPYLAALARAVAGGEVDPEAWDTDERTPSELRQEMTALPGVGPYVAENVLKFLGRPDGLALDSWMRAEYARTYHDGRRVTDRTIARRYGGLGRWAGLAIWCDLTRGWLDSADPAETRDRL